VDNVLGTQIGHLPRKVAEKLAEYMDKGEITLEAKLTGEIGYFEVPIRVYISGTSDPSIRPRLEESLKADRLVKATELKKTKKENELARQIREKLGITTGQTTVGLRKEDGKKPSKPTMEELALASQVSAYESQVDFLKGLGAMDEDQLSKMAMAKQPDAIKTKLLPYQLQGLAWLVGKESPKYPAQGSDESIQLWKHDARGRYVNLVTNIATANQPKLVSGGILADEMGLGKTLQTIALIMSNGKGKTLIVAPNSVMSNWKQPWRLAHQGRERAAEVRRGHHQLRHPGQLYAAGRLAIQV
jgi:SWI/SNF-related matrix-associated actin-dependent regulator of chromatin subfamily A3